MLKRESFPIERIYVPAKRHAMLDRARVNVIAESMLVSGQMTPIMVRADGASSSKVCTGWRRQKHSAKQRYLDSLSTPGSTRGPDLE